MRLKLISLKVANSFRPDWKTPGERKLLLNGHLFRPVKNFKHLLKLMFQSNVSQAHDVHTKVTFSFTSVFNISIHSFMIPTPWLNSIASLFKVCFYRTITQIGFFK